MPCLIGLAIPLIGLLLLILLATPPHRRAARVRQMAQGCLALGVVLVVVACLGTSIMVAGR